MQHSTRRILTTHAGSLPRPPDLLDMTLAKQQGRAVDEAARQARLPGAVKGNARLPKDKVLIPGVISHSTVLVEHPELIAERIVKFASLVGKERVIAGSDCGFATFAGSKEVHPSIVWAKMQALTEGARLASKKLWKKGGKKKAGKKKAVRAKK